MPLIPFVFRKILRRLNRIVGVYPFLLRNIYKSFFLPPLEENTYNGFVYRALERKDYNDLTKTYSTINKGRVLRWHIRLLYALCGNKYALIVEDCNGEKIVGLQLFYFNKKDKKNNTIHSFFTGVVPSAQGLGIGTQMLKYAAYHFAQCKLGGITAKVARKNTASIMVYEQKLGFNILETYGMPSTKAEWHYLEWLFYENQQ